MTQDFFTIWLPFIYLYGVGSIFFVLGMIIIKKSGAVNLQIDQNADGTRCSSLDLLTLFSSTSF